MAQRNNLYISPTAWIKGTPPTSLEDTAIATITNRMRWHRNDAAQLVAAEMKGDWSFTSPKGKLMKRVKNLWFKVYKEEIPYQISNDITRAISANNIPPYFYQITDRLDWEKGEYADRDSCFWTFNKGCRAVFVAGGGHAIVLRKAENESTRGAGLGRAFLFPHQGTVFVSNQYGLTLDFYIKLMQKHLEKELNVKTITTKGVLNLHAKLPYGDERSFYDNGDTQILSVVRPPTTKAPILFDGCRCAAHYNHRETTGLRVCANCPFERDGQLEETVGL